jgi:hypothetical protein
VTQAALKFFLQQAFFVDESEIFRNLSTAVLSKPSHGLRPSASVVE